MAFRLPAPVKDRDNDEAVRLLRRYYHGVDKYVGAHFDEWDPSGRRSVDADRFTSDDLVAVSLLSIDVPGRTAISLLGDSATASTLNALLGKIEADRNLVDVADGEIGPDWPAWQLWTELKKVDGVGWVTAAKLLARKRPRLLPVYDTRVKHATGGDTNFWEPLRRALRMDDRRLHHWLLELRGAADLPDAVSALRVFDVIAWMSEEPSTSR
jgi:hypothetical protein